MIFFVFFGRLVACILLFLSETMSVGLRLILSLGVELYIFRKWKIRLAHQMVLETPPHHSTLIDVEIETYN